MRPAEAVKGDHAKYEQNGAQRDSRSCLRVSPREPNNVDWRRTAPIPSEKLGQKEFPQITNAPAQVLSAWAALEVLSPTSLRRPEDLVGGDRRFVASFKEQNLPWERGEKWPNFRLYYQIILGTIKMDGAIERLVDRFGDSRPERPQGKGEAILAIAIVDKEGRLVASPAVTVSSFGWGVMAALKGGLTDLARWPEIEPEIVRRVEKELLSFAQGETDDEKRKVPITRRALLSAYQALLRQTGLPADMVEAPSFAIRSYQHATNPNPPEVLILNSFFLNDLGMGRKLFKEKKAPDNLKRYLGELKPETRADLLRDNAALEQVSAPSVTSLSRWPSQGRYPLAVLQQAAVNLAFSETRNGGILGVNGPPGTGKTTLLRDILAGIVTERAEAMCKFDEPESAFMHSGERLKAGNGWLNLYRVDASIRGFEMVVASSNNKAVENVSRELPAMTSIAADTDDLRYFKVLSDKLHGRDTWGMVAAVLGNAANRARFKETFWWDEDLGLNSYLSAATGSVPQISAPDPITGMPGFRSPKIVAEEKPPKNHEDALVRWNAARTHFRSVLEESRAGQMQLESLRHELLKLDGLVAEKNVAQGERDATILTVQNAAESLEDGKARFSRAVKELEEHENSLRRHYENRPGIWARLYQTANALTWAGTRKVFRTAVKEAQSHVDEESRKHVSAADLLHVAIEANRKSERRLSEAVSARTTTEALLKAAKEKLGAVLPDDEFFAKERSQKHQATLWYSAEAQRARDDLFTASIQLHRAFVDAAAKPLRHNLGALMNVLPGNSLPSSEKENLLSDLWATLFLVVPLVSTTFAAFSRMFGKLPPESLGWFLIDEGGQALPQAAVGAIIRSKRVIVVGDPAQIEPVVTLPDALTNAISRSFGVDPDIYMAPVASAQTLADSASSFASEFRTKSASRSVGVPLLVHRRCAEPMFTISNAIAYSGLMVQAKTPKPSAIRDALGKSRWIHVEGGSDDKWCPEEGAEVIRVLGLLADARVAPDLYIVTPFVIVADRLRQLIRESGILRRLIPEDEMWKWLVERVGTVHTVQGREAEAVILVLGASNTGQTGARGWAGGRPNLLNVALTRAKEVVYVIGNRAMWREAGHFCKLDAHLK